MLTLCEDCTQVVELGNLMHHKLHECEAAQYQEVSPFLTIVSPVQGTYPGQPL